MCVLTDVVLLHLYKCCKYIVQYMFTSIVVFSDIAEYMGDGVTHIVTESKWDDNFDEVCVCYVCFL